MEGDVGKEVRLVSIGSKRKAQSSVRVTQSAWHRGHA